MEEALDAKDYSKAVALAEKVLKKNFVDIKAHWVAHQAHSRLKKADQSKFHRYVYDGLIQSIVKSGDGKTTATAYVVISVDEEYAVLNFLGIEMAQQGLLRHEDQHFDRIAGVDNKHQKSSTVYFNVTKPLSWRQNRSAIAK
jgi:hypothetical protein